MELFIDRFMHVYFWTYLSAVILLSVALVFAHKKGVKLGFKKDSEFLKLFTLTLWIVSWMY